MGRKHTRELSGRIKGRGDGNGLFHNHAYTLYFNLIIALPEILIKSELKLKSLTGLIFFSLFSHSLSYTPSPFHLMFSFSLTQTF